MRSDNNLSNRNVSQQYQGKSSVPKTQNVPSQQPSIDSQKSSKGINQKQVLEQTEAKPGFLSTALSYLNPFSYFASSTPKATESGNFSLTNLQDSQPSTPSGSTVKEVEKSTPAPKPSPVVKPLVTTTPTVSSTSVSSVPSKKSIDFSEALSSFEKGFKGKVNSLDGYKNKFKDYLNENNLTTDIDVTKLKESFNNFKEGQSKSTSTSSSPSVASSSSSSGPTHIALPTGFNGISAQIKTGKGYIAALLPQSVLDTVETHDKNFAKKFKTALEGNNESGFVRANGQAGVKQLKGDNTKFELKILGNNGAGDARIFGNYDDKSKTITFNNFVAKAH